MKSKIFKFKRSNNNNNDNSNNNNNKDDQFCNLLALLKKIKIVLVFKHKQQQNISAFSLNCESAEAPWLHLPSLPLSRSLSLSPLARHANKLLNYYNRFLAAALSLSLFHAISFATGSQQKKKPTLNAVARPTEPVMRI